MQRYFTSLCSALLFVIASASTSLAQAEQTQERIIDVMNELALALDAHQDDCDASAQALRAWGERYRTELPSLVVASQALEDDPEGHFGAALEDAMLTVYETAMRCSEHQDCNDAFDELDAVLCADGRCNEP
ncbi:MAG: hypothetical protein RBU37_01035 [Myxococcota bacterium]|jgi:hypothetical protein|nr:hypothetical protein [Myxococcota bacterium]